MTMRDLHAAEERVDATDDAALLLSLAHEIRSRFAAHPETEVVVRRALSKWLRVRREQESQRASRSPDLSLAAAMIAEIRDARSIAQLLQLTASIRRHDPPSSAWGILDASSWMRLARAVSERDPG